MTRHLGMQVSAYVDRRLDAATLREFDRHLVACQVCRHTAEQERRLLESLRTGATPGLSSDLQSMLLGLGTAAAPSAPGPQATRHPLDQPSPWTPAATHGGRVPLRTVAPASPALHRSPRRAAVLAGLAAGASAAAAFGLAVGAPATISATPSRQPAARVPGPAFNAETAVSLVSRVSQPAAVGEPLERRAR